MKNQRYEERQSVRARLCMGLLLAALIASGALPPVAHAAEDLVSAPSERLALAVGQALQLGTILEDYRLDNGRYPYRLEDLIGFKGTSEKALRDPWGRKYNYYGLAGRYVLVTFGKSGKPTQRNSPNDNNEETDVMITNGCLMGIPRGIGGTGNCTE